MALFRNHLAIKVLLLLSTLLLFSGIHGENLKTCARPVALLVTGGEEDGIRLAEEGIRYIEEQRSPVYVIPVVGTYRSGKTFTLNRLMGLQAPYASGFGVGHTQETFTTGIQVCAQEIEGVDGTVIWMDTEGLFSKEDQKKRFGAKIFSLALLLSSVMITNSQGVLNGQFFEYFDDQQKTARILGEALVAAGLPEDVLMPQGLPIVWVVTRPTGGTGAGTSEVLQHQLQTFLEGSTWDEGSKETHSKVQASFRHWMQQLPSATVDSDLWMQLDKVSDDKLRPAFVESLDDLRRSVISKATSMRAWQATSLSRVLKPYVELVQEKKFDPKDARLQFGYSRRDQICNEFIQHIRGLVGPLPASNLTLAIAPARAEALEKAKSVAEKYQFDGFWLQQLHDCLDSEVKALERESVRLLLVRWKDEARQSVEQGTNCFFFTQLMNQRNALVEAYAVSIEDDFVEETVSYAVDQQRARLVGCFRARNFLWPLLPWIGYLVVVFIQQSPRFTLGGMLFYGASMVLLYAFLQAFKLLPTYLDLDHPILQTFPVLLDTLIFMLRAAPWVPWPAMADNFWRLGLLLCGANVVRFLYSYMMRGKGDVAGGIKNMEFMQHSTLLRLHGLMNERVVAAVLDATKHAGREEGPLVIADLLRGLSLFSDSAGIASDVILQRVLKQDLLKQIQKLLKDTRLHTIACNIEGDSDISRQSCELWRSQYQSKVVKSALQSSYTNWDETLTQISKFLSDVAKRCS